MISYLSLLAQSNLPRTKLMLAWIACSTAAFFAPCVHPCSVSPTTRSANLVAVSGGKLDQALGSLNPADQYNVLLRSLLSSPEDASSRASAMQLIDEMSERSLSLRPDSVVELVDGAMSDKWPVASTVGLLAALLATRRNGATPAFGSSAAWFPSAAIPPSSALPPLPEDEQGAEVTGAAGLAGLLGTAAVVAHPPAGLVLPALGTVWAADRYNQQGKFFDLLGKGVSRLFSQDLRRECTIESGAFLLGYLLGLPCCALAPSSDAALQMLADGNRAGCWLSYEAPERIVDRVLIWLLAPAGIASAVGGPEAAEAAPVRKTRTFLQRLLPSRPVLRVPFSTRLAGERRRLGSIRSRAAGRSAMRMTSEGCDGHTARRVRLQPDSVAFVSSWRRRWWRGRVGGRVRAAD